MKIKDPQIEKQGQMLLRVILVLSIFIVAVTTTYGIIASVVQGVEVVGKTLVTVEFPPPELVPPPFYSKPVTWLSVALLAALFSSLELNKDRIAAFSSRTKVTLKVLLFVVGGMAFYEVLFNFTLWSGLIAADAIRLQLNPDLIINPFPNPKTPWNIVFATKLFTVLTIASFYSFFFLHRIEKQAQSH